jgi:MFS family permease
VFRSVLSVVVGLALAITISDIVEAIGDRMYPPQVSADGATPEVILKAQQAAPPGAFVMVLVAWYLGTSTGAGTAAYLASRFRWRHGWIVAGILLLVAIIKMCLAWHPVWFWLAAFVVIPVAATVGMLIGTQPVPGKREGYVIEGPPDYSAEAEQRMKMAGR